MRCLLDYRFLYSYCPGPEWSVMCRGCCEYDVIHCKCPLQGYPVGYAVPCCRNAVNECDPCIIHPGEQITHKHLCRYFSIFSSLLVMHVLVCSWFFTLNRFSWSYIFNNSAAQKQSNTWQKYKCHICPSVHPGLWFVDFANIFLWNLVNKERVSAFLPFGFNG